MPVRREVGVPFLVGENVCGKKKNRLDQRDTDAT